MNLGDIMLHAGLGSRFEERMFVDTVDLPIDEGGQSALEFAGEGIAAQRQARCGVASCALKFTCDRDARIDNSNDPGALMEAALGGGDLIETGASFNIICASCENPDNARAATSVLRSILP